jgi:RND family efflux transporter MFP subunit
MPLVKRKRGEATQLPADVLARVQLTPNRIALAGVSSQAIGYRKLERTVRAVGTLDYNETKLARLSARVAGRVDELFVRYVGQSVNKGDPLYSLYSPEVYTAQREYLLARKRVMGVGHEETEDAKMDATAVYNAAMQKLVLWGVTPAQLDEMDKRYDASGEIPTHLTVTSPIAGIVTRKDVQEGQYLMMGEAPFTIADLSTLWLLAKVYERDVPLVQIGQIVSIGVEGSPNESYEGTVTFRAYQIDPQTRTMDARVELANPGLKLRPGMYAEATIRVPITANEPTTQATSGPTTNSVDASAVFMDAAAPYLKAQAAMSLDQIERVPEWLAETAEKLRPLANRDELKDAVARVAAAAKEAKGQDIEALRKTFGELSDAMIQVAQSVELPPDAPELKVFRCPMIKAKPYWIQLAGQTANPLMGKRMQTCGSAVSALPRHAPEEATARAATQHVHQPGNVLAVPRSAVIDTGERRIVYVDAGDGAFDMRAVRLGALGTDGTREYYPVLKGLNEGDRVATNGAFLLDAENRLNPGK